MNNHKEQKGEPMSFNRKRIPGTTQLHPDSIKEVIAMRKDIVACIKDAAKNPGQYIDVDWSKFEDQWDDKLTHFKQWI